MSLPFSLAHRPLLVSQLTEPPPPPPHHPCPCSVALGQAAGDRTGNLQDVLRLLTLWFTWGSAPDVESALNEGFGLVSIDTWLGVIPQIIARIHTNNPQVGAEGGFVGGGGGVDGSRDGRHLGLTTLVLVARVLVACCRWWQAVAGHKTQAISVRIPRLLQSVALS